MAKIYTNDEIVQYVGVGEDPTPKGKPQIMIGVPCGDVFYKPYVLSLARTLIRLGNKYKFVVTMVGSCYVHRNRNDIIKHAKDRGVDYLLMVDSDSVWKPEDVEALIKMDKPVANGWYLSRNQFGDEKNNPVVMKRDNGKYGIVKDIPSEPFTCDAIGAGFMLLTKEVIDTMVEKGKPFDMLKADEMGLEAKDNTALVGEDVSFCYVLQKAGFDIWVDPKVHIGHANIDVVRR